MKKKTDSHETPAGGSTHPHFSMSTSTSTPDVMTQNSAYGTIASADARDHKISDVMTQNSAYGQLSTANDGNQEYDYISV